MSKTIRLTEEVINRLDKIRGRKSYNDILVDIIPLGMGNRDMISRAFTKFRNELRDIDIPDEIRDPHEGRLAHEIALLLQELTYLDGDDKNV